VVESPAGQIIVVRDGTIDFDQDLLWSITPIENYCYLFRYVIAKTEVFANSEIYDNIANFAIEYNKKFINSEI
jgi:hypothetical protein